MDSTDNHDPIAALHKEIRKRIESTKIVDAYSAGKVDGLKCARFVLEAVMATTVCPTCGGPLTLDYADHLNELVVFCDTWKCGFEQALNQIGY